MFDLKLLNDESFWMADDVVANLFKSKLSIGIHHQFSLDVVCTFYEQRYIPSSESYFKDDTFYFNLRLFKLGVLVYIDKNRGELTINRL